MFGLTCSCIGQALLLQVFDVDIEQATEADTIIENFTGPQGMRMHFEHFFVTSNDSGDASHVDNGLANLFNVQFFPTEQEDNFVAKLFFDGDAPLFDISFAKCSGSSQFELGCFSANVSPDTL